MIEHEWIDVSLTIKSGMVHWPGDPPVLIKRVRDLDKDDSVNLSEISMGVHSGTHVDAPLHFIKGEKAAHQILFDSLIGPARVIEIADQEAVKKAELAEHGIKEGERILLKTLNSKKKILKKDVFSEDFVYIEEGAAELLASRRVKTVGVDYLSVGGYKKDGANVHRLLLGSGMLLIEGLDLTRVSPGHYDMICLPMKLFGSDGAPARVILKKREA